MSTRKRLITRITFVYKKFGGFAVRRRRRKLVTALVFRVSRMPGQSGRIGTPPFFRTVSGFTRRRASCTLIGGRGEEGMQLSMNRA